MKVPSFGAVNVPQNRAAHRFALIPGDGGTGRHLKSRFGTMSETDVPCNARASVRLVLLQYTTAKPSTGNWKFTFTGEENSDLPGHTMSSAVVSKRIALSRRGWEAFICFK